MTKLLKASKQHEKGAHPVNQAAVLGAGIMGGGMLTKRQAKALQSS